MDSRIQQRSFTGTKGIGIDELIYFDFQFDRSNYPELNDGVCSLEEFEQSPRISPQAKTKTRSKLLALREGLKNKYSNNVDPIEYIVFLYFEEGLSLQDVHIRISALGLEYSSYKALWGFLTRTLSWKCKDKYEFSEVQKKRARNKDGLKKMQQSNQGLVQENAAKFEKALSETLIGKNSKENFDIEKFQSFGGKGSKGEKIWYILKTQFDITPEVLKEIQKKTGLGARTFARILETRIKTFLIEKGIEDKIEISSGYLSHSLK